jgi:restriction system protein
LKGVNSLHPIADSQCNVLIDGEKLAQYMIDYNLGVSVQNVYEIKKLDTDYFEEE